MEAKTWRRWGRRDLAAAWRDMVREGGVWEGSGGLLDSWEPEEPAAEL